MTAQSAGAASHKTIAWQSIDWEKAHRTVRRLQVRIAKATQEGRWGKVKALQRLLTHSFSGKVLAVKRVTENKGRRTPGVDGETWNTPEKKAKAIQMLQTRGYCPQPLKRTYIPKKNGKMRPLGIPTMRDRAMQALYLQALEPVAETTGDWNSYGFRPERSAADAIVRCHMLLSGLNRPQWVLEGDIKSCFDKISHNWLVANVPIDKAILRKWLKSGYMERYVFHPTEEGSPQGGIISPVLANLTLDGLERELQRTYPGTKQGNSPMVNYVRFADDFVITGRSQELLENGVEPLVENFLNERGLELSQEKTVITHVEDGFDFLGKHIRKCNKAVLTEPSKKSVKTHLDKAREIIKTNLALDAGRLIMLLNPLIRGWAQYHQYGAATKTFRKIDYAIFKALWAWAKRRHPKKSQHWIAKKYFRSMPGRAWTFHGRVEGKNRDLFYAGSIRMIRHIKIRMDANPYDPEWEVYLEERKGLKMARTLKGRNQLLYLWKEQNGICPVCNQKITELTDWDNHHIVWQSNGGSDKAENRVLLHPTCHRQVHSLKPTVEKPCPVMGIREA